MRKILARFNCLLHRTEINIVGKKKNYEVFFSIVT